MKAMRSAVILLLVVFTVIFVFSQYANSKTLSSKPDKYVQYYDEVNKTASWLKKKTNNAQPKVMIVLNGGVSGPEKNLIEKTEISFADVPGFAEEKVQGYAGKLIFGKLDGNDVVLMKGRFHYCEGNSARKVVFPYFVMHELGVRSLITFNAVGGIREDLNTGDIMLVTDHINAMGDNPLRGLALLRSENQFTDMTDAYCKKYQTIARVVAQEHDIELAQGVYLATMGPCYETKAEIKAFRAAGADTVGMSTVFEVIACNFLGIDVLAFCAIANPAADRHGDKITHEEVLKTMKAMAPKLLTLVSECAQKILSK